MRLTIVSNNFAGRITVYNVVHSIKMALPAVNRQLLHAFFLADLCYVTEMNVFILVQISRSGPGMEFQRAFLTRTEHANPVMIEKYKL